MKCSNIPIMAELIALLMHMLEIHWLNAQLQAKWPLHGTVAWGWVVWSSYGMVLHGVERYEGLQGEARSCSPLTHILWALQNTGSAAEAQQKPTDGSRVVSGPGTQHPTNNQHLMAAITQERLLCQGLSSLDSFSPGRCRSAGAHTDLRDAENAEGEHQILPQSLTLCPAFPHAGQCHPIAKEGCCPQVLPQGPGSVPSSLHGECGGFKKGMPVPTGLPAIPWSHEDLCVMVQLHFHRLLLPAPCHH